MKTLLDNKFRTDTPGQNLETPGTSTASKLALVIATLDEGKKKKPLEKARKWPKFFKSA